ncbi:MAG TPA: preprotein translocase subunit SecA [Clostridiales bacterium UBA8153]|nr:preprotein translocase subunit SecA [Clostridiales bacterium UBA8153]
MLKGLAAWLNVNERELKKYRPLLSRVNQMEPDMLAMSDGELASLTGRFRQRLASGEPLDGLVPEAFAAVREVARRSLGERPFDTQVLGGLVLHQGKIAEMKTGEGKTLAATMPAYLNALTGKGVHVVTVNDYLARRDSEWMGQIYRFLGLDVGLIIHDIPVQERQLSYRAGITYGTNNEFGFDYLRDNMVFSAQQMVQRELHYAIIDEVDSILIDEARTPLIISGSAEQSTDLYRKFAALARTLKDEVDYTVDEKARTAVPTESAMAKTERAMGVDNLAEHLDLSHHLMNALKAKTLFRRDRDYVVKDGQIIIVDQFTGRLMYGRRYSDGLHQALEAKEGVKVERESQTLATITFQNYFRMYKKLAGMTGTALTEADEFHKIYKLEVVAIPTHLEMIRVDHADVVYRNEQAKFEAVVEEICQRHATGQPVLVGTISIEKSEQLSGMLERRGIKHQVLNAKFHAKEAEIVAQAGRPNTVTISTNMAGRGTDIVLGGNPAYAAREELRRGGYPPEVVAVASDKFTSADEQVLAARQEYASLLVTARQQVQVERGKVLAVGGLHIIGTERHESRRIDNQLRGRSGRQGDPGSSRFYLSLDDDLMRLFGSDSIAGIMDRIGFDESEPIEHKLVSRAIENAQRRVEARNFEARKHVLEYDNVMNRQREVVYGYRRRMLQGEDLSAHVQELIADVVEGLVAVYAHEGGHSEDWNLPGLIGHAESLFLPSGSLSPRDLAEKERSDLVEQLAAAARQAYAERESQLGPGSMRNIERVVLLHVVDQHWVNHLTGMDELREGIGLRAYGQRDPLLEYQSEAYGMFQSMQERIKEDVVRYLFRARLEPKEEPLRRERPASHAAGQAGRSTAQRQRKVGRNDPCPCGSGKKFKKCCGS